MIVRCVRAVSCVIIKVGVCASVDVVLCLRAFLVLGAQCASVCRGWGMSGCCLTAALLLFCAWLYVANSEPCEWLDRLKSSIMPALCDPAPLGGLLVQVFSLRLLSCS